MAKLVICSVYDSAAEVYQRLFLARAPNEALRGFMDACADVNHEFHKHPEHFTLFHLGVFDERTAEIEILKAHKVLSRAVDLVVPAEDCGGA
jgi:hypothetical protein